MTSTNREEEKETTGKLPEEIARSAMEDLTDEEIAEIQASIKSAMLRATITNFIARFGLAYFITTVILGLIGVSLASGALALIISLVVNHLVFD